MKLPAIPFTEFDAVAGAAPALSGDEAQPLLPGVPPALVHPNPITGGPVPDIETRLDLRRRLLNQDGVFAVHDIEPHSDNVGIYFYLIECTYVFPRFVIGITTSDLDEPVVLFQSGALWSAQDAWLTRESL